MIKKIVLIFFFYFALSIYGFPGVQVKHVHNVEELVQALTGQPNNLRIQLDPGIYSLSPTSSIDSTCGNCEDPVTTVTVTVGLKVSGRRLHIVGPDSGLAEIVTHAGYGIFFFDCEDCSISKVSITGGQRDPDGNATDAAIVVKKSSVTISDDYIHNNIGDSSIVAELIVGIMGIAGREESYLTIENNRIIRNSWDGIALYRGAEAIIRNNIIDGVDKARGSQIGGGRGVGIGITWNAKATIEGNLVTRYWKGIGLFVDADAYVRENIVEDIITWGIILWDADKGKPRGRIEWNVVYQTGACGVGIIVSDSTDLSPGYLRNNAIIETAQNPRYDDPDYYCYQCALAVHDAPENFEIVDNWFTNNRRASSDLPNYDMPKEKFRQLVGSMLSKLRVRRALQSSIFLNYMLE